MCVVDTYRSIAGPAQGLFRDKGSRFIALAYPVETEEEVRALLAKARKEYYDARHHCCAYRIGHDGSRWRAGDDGEPAGSAGRPILGRIDAAGLSDVAVIVVRYFGGIKLGIPGLVRAYKAAASDALSAAGVVEKVAGEWRRLDFPYSSLPAVMKLMKDMSLPQRAQSFRNECSLEAFVRLSAEKDFLERMKKLGIFND